jgi:hypothetical protein
MLVTCIHRYFIYPAQNMLIDNRYGTVMDIRCIQSMWARLGVERLPFHPAVSLAVGQAAKKNP